MKAMWPAVAVILTFGNSVGADEKKPSLAEDAKSLVSLPETAWLSQPIAVAVEAKALGGKKDDKLRLAIKLRPDKDAAKGSFVLGLVNAEDKDGTVIHRSFNGTFELTEKEGKRFLNLNVDEGAKKQTLPILYSLADKKLTFPKGVTVEGWEASGVKVYLSPDKSIDFSAR
jgi:hypothetical protein